MLRASAEHTLAVLCFGTLPYRKGPGNSAKTFNVLELRRYYLSLWH